MLRFRHNVRCAHSFHERSKRILALQWTQAASINAYANVLIRVRYPAWGEEIFLSHEHESKRLHMRLLMPLDPVEALGCVLIIHGMNEYVGRYAEIATHLAQRFIVAGIDLPGHQQMGLEMARQSGVTLISRAKGKHFLILNGLDNIKFDVSDLRQPLSAFKAVEGIVD